MENVNENPDMPQQSEAEKIGKEIDEKLSRKIKWEQRLHKVGSVLKPAGLGIVIVVAWVSLLCIGTVVIESTKLAVQDNMRT